MGAPIEFSTPLSYGTKHGPKVLRAASKVFLGGTTEEGSVPFDMCRIIEYGEVDNLGLNDL